MKKIKLDKVLDLIIIIIINQIMLLMLNKIKDPNINLKLFKILNLLLFLNK
jgi:hypothetical protein